MESVTIKLRRPITAYKETLTELTLREPTGKDIRTCGLPYGGKSRAVEFNAEAVAQLIAVCAGIPTSSVDKLCAADFNDAMMAIVSFFGDAAEEISSRDTSTSAASGATSAT